MFLTQPSSIFTCGWNVWNIFFCQQHKQIHDDSTNHTGSSASIWTTSDGCFPACETVRLWVMRPWYVNDLWTVKTSLQNCYVFQIACKGWSLLWFRNHLHQLRKIRCKCNRELSKIPHAFHCPYENLYLWM